MGAVTPMTLLRLSKLFLNLHKLVDAEELDEPPGRLEVTMESGRVRILDEADSAVLRAALQSLTTKRQQAQNKGARVDLVREPDAGPRGGGNNSSDDSVRRAT